MKPEAEGGESEKVRGGERWDFSSFFLQFFVRHIVYVSVNLVESSTRSRSEASGNEGITCGV